VSMELVEILNEIKKRGLRAVIRGGVLFIGPGDKVGDELRGELKSNMASLLAHFACGGNASVEWRTAEMLTQLLPLSWPCPIPTLHAKPDAEPNKEGCKSCGELLDTGEGDSFICGACARAKDLAIDLWMARIRSARQAA
jgi:hypothetical protein